MYSKMKIVNGVQVIVSIFGTVVSIDCKRGFNSIYALIGKYSGATIDTFGEISKDRFNVFSSEILRYYGEENKIETYNF